MKKNKNAPKGRKKVVAGKFKGSPSKDKSKGKFGKTEKPVDKDVYNRADASMKKLVGEKGVPRKKYILH